MGLCTAITYRTKDFYFGRTLDYEHSYVEEVTVTPRRFPFSFRHGETIGWHYALIGMAYVTDGYPLYYDAVNEHGLCMAGLNFVGNAYFGHPMPETDNVAVFEFIPRVLGQCRSVIEVRMLLHSLRLVDTPFSDTLPPAPLHWLIADRQEAITVEAVQEGLRVHDNPVGVLTNNPPFEQQLFRLNDYMHLSPWEPKNRFSEHLPLHTYSRGMGALGLPGDLSSSSRFVRAAFVKMNGVSGEGETDSVNQLFHMLGAVEQQRGCCRVGDKQYETTIYTSCCNADKGIYYYTTYDNHQITAVSLHRGDPDGEKLTRYPLIRGEQLRWQN